ncbi:dihydrofolate reductase [Spongiimicrobium salis]|uniref:dihydrofolate reductase n=1 Tax=Spongiimicrobium salis TaxID=1667022 RepID=UPI00374C9F99
MIAAAGENNALGKDNDLLWRLPDDFKRFKTLTMGHTIIMGRKTFESLPSPLPRRTHIIVTRDQEYTVDFPDCLVVHSMESAIALVSEEEQAYIIGGGEIYALGMEISQKLELTRVHGTFNEADTFFPEVDTDIWKLTAEEHHPKDERHQYAFTYLTYVKKGV